LVLLLLVLLTLYLCYYKCKEKRAHSRVGSMDANQRLVSGVDAAPTSATTHAQLTQPAAVNDRAVLAQTTTATIGYASENPLRTANFETSSKQLPAKEQTASLRELPASALSTNAEIAVGTRPLATEKTMETWVSRNNTLPPLGTRETTMGSNPREETLMRIRRGELFERPRVAVLDNVSAISLDEFWSKDERPFHR
uniref:Uncharacterized protein n=1 Tax=Parascaris univalens TaxID=6257 RepID=A0A915BZJ0_PARUN